MAKLQALLFDVDGTLADTEKDGHRVAFNLAFKTEGLDWYWDEPLYGKLLSVTGGKERIKFYLEQFNTNFNKPTDLDSFIKQLHALKTQYYVELMQAGKVPLRIGVEALIKEAKHAKMRMAIVTTTTPANVTALLNNTLGKGSESWFEVIAAGDIIPCKKPAPDIYNWTLEQMDLKAEQVIAFEDSRNGILSATAASIKTIITVNEYTKDDDFTSAALVLDSMGSINEPFKILAGNAFSNSYLNLDLITKIAEN